jgi:hypothetical protein
MTVNIPCNGEVVTVSGTEHNTFQITFDGTGDSHLDMNDNFVDVTGTGSFGNTYQIPSAVQNSFNARLGFEETLTETFNVISQGSAPNFLLDIDAHITVHPDGTVTALHDTASTTCRG